MTFAQPFQDYELLDRVGAGAMGTVFKARHKRLNRIVALKVLKPSLARDKRYVDRLRREARIVASLNHPNIVTGYDLGEEGGYHYFVMEFVEGKSLRQLLLEWGMFAEEYVQRVARQVAQALDHAFSRGVIHRDIKPGNILIDEQGELKLTDMGLAKGPADLTLTRDGATVGTPQYISPEQARNPQDVDVRSDLYSLGATLYHMATGVPPFRGDTMADLITKVLNDVPAPPDELNPALSSGMSLVIRKLLAKDLRIRYQTPRELLDDLDRVEQKQPPKVDVARLSSSESPRANLLLRSLAVAGVAGLLGVALWIGTQLTDSADSAPTADEFLLQLDGELRALPTPGARLRRLHAVDAPPGCESQLLLRGRTVNTELQASVDGAVAALLGPEWPALEAWLRDPLVWPDRARCERERIGPRLREVAGVDLGQLPPSLRMLQLDDLLRRVDRELLLRDQELVTRFDAFLASTVPARSSERMRAGDFEAAERLWSDARTTFLDGAGVPLPERLSPVTAQRLVDAHERAWLATAPSLDAAETAVAEAMRAEAESVARRLGELLAEGESPDLVAEAVQRLRQDLSQVWPAQGRFRAGRDPWPEIERLLGVLNQGVAAARDRVEAQRFDRRCDLVWRSYCHGGASDALMLLAGVGSVSPRHAALQARHRAVLEAAQAVEAAMLAVLARASAPVVAFPLTGPAQAVELRVEKTQAGLTLMCQGIGQPARTARLTEFRFGDLLMRLRQQVDDPMRAVPKDQFAVGAAVATMAGGELSGMGTLLAELEAEEDHFLVEEVWPRILAVRNEHPEPAFDRQSLFAALRTARESAARTGSLNELEAAILTCQTRLSGADMSDAERAELRSATTWLQLERRRRELAAELERSVPTGARATVRVLESDLVAEVTVDAAALHRGAAESWQLRADALEFAGGDRPWGDLPLLQLRCDPGLPPAAPRWTATLEIVLPPATVGRRTYVVEFRGIAVLLTVAANDLVYAALVDGDPLREDAAQRAFQRAILGALVPARAMVVPGAVHLLTIDVTASSARNRAAVEVAFEGAVLAREVAREVDPRQAPTVVVYPQQDVAVKRLSVRGAGL